MEKNRLIPKTARTFMPEILYPGTGLSPLTDKSIIPTNNVTTIQDVLDGKQYKLPGGGGSWGVGDDLDASYKDEGDGFRREVRDLDIFKKMLDHPQISHEEWTLRVPGGVKTFTSLPMAQQYKRGLEQKGIQVEWISRTRTAQNKSKQDIVSQSLLSTFKVVVTNHATGMQSNGAAFCVAENTFLTCAHVVKKYNKSTGEKINILGWEREAEMQLVQGNKRYEATIHSISEVLDIAIITAKIDAVPFVLDKKCNIGDDVMAIGSPHGFENNASFGNISSLHRVIYTHNGAPEYMFIDANVFSGNSGGPIINVLSGKVVGMVTAIAAASGEYGLNAGLPSFYLEKFCLASKIPLQE